VLNAFLCKGERQIGQTDFPGQKLHPIFDELKGQPAIVRGKKTHYNPPNLQSYVAATLGTFKVPIYEDLLREAAREASKKAALLL